MSSMRNAVQRRPHRERAQPLERRRLGLLEKHKDYSLRAQDYNKKKAHLKNLRDKAAERNEDEFYFGMMSRRGPGSRVKDGKRWVGTVEGDRGNKAMDVDTVRLLKTQDLGYVRTMKQVAARELVRLEERAVLARGLDRAGQLGDADVDMDNDDDDDDDGGDDEDDDDVGGRGRAGARQKGPRKIVFMDDEEEREDVLRQALEGEVPAGKDGKGEEDGDEKGKARSVEDRAKLRKRLQKELELARKKVKVLASAEAEMEVQKAKMAKTATSGGETRRGKKIMVRRRKR